MLKDLKEAAILKGLRFQLKPRKGFDDTASPDPYDYSDIAAWAAHPNKKSKADLIPQGTEARMTNPEVDVFYVHPTSLFSKSYWNEPSDFQKSRAMTDEMTMPGQASAFNAMANVYAPYYRQCTFYSFLDQHKDCHRALDVAYSDVKNAFRHFIDNFNENRPFILAGHSQGSLHGIRLLEELIDGDEELRQRCIAAYLIGFQIPLDKFGTSIQHFKPAKSATDTQVVIAYDTYGYEGGPIHKRDSCAHYYPASQEWQPRANKIPVQINPMNWTTSHDEALESQHLGAITLKFSAESQFDWLKIYNDDPLNIDVEDISKPIPNELSCSLGNDRFLRISTPKTKTFRLGLFPGKNYHIHDYALFYMNIRENVKDRIKSFMAK